MDTVRRAQVRSVVETLGDVDLAYAETTLQAAYAAEIDRKDKILSSMVVVGTPLTILFAGVAFLTNTFLDAGQNMLAADPDIAVATFYAVAVVVVLLVASVLFNAARLLGGENYYYLPSADDTLDSMARLKEYCLGNGLAEDGRASRYARLDNVFQLAECATRNAAANDLRLKYRQRVFSRTVWAIVFAALAFILIAFHHQEPDMFHLSRIWSNVDASRNVPAPSPAGNGVNSPGTAPSGP